MYSFIKWLGSLMERAKKNKGFWFTFLSVISIIGIFLSLFFVNYLVSDVAKKTYENQKNSFQLRLKSQFITQKDRTLVIATTATQNDEVKNLFVSDDINASNKIKKSAKQLQMKISKNLDNKNFSVNFEQNEKFAELKIINGIDVGDNGTHFKATVPFVKTETFVSNIIVRENIETLVNVFKNENREFLFIINESGINKVDTSIRKQEYKKIFKDYNVKEDAYSGNFINDVRVIDFEKLSLNGYLKDKNYFYVSQSVFDIDGDEIGVAIIAEDMSADNSFVNLVKNLVNSVTTVALGLIVSMVLFLF